MNQDIEKLIETAKRELGKSDSYPFLPEILESLSKMQDSLQEPRERRERVASALERLVLEDLRFSESELGEKILDIAEKFAN